MNQNPTGGKVNLSKSSELSESKNSNSLWNYVNFKTIERYALFVSVIVGIFIPMWELKDNYRRAQQEEKIEREQQQSERVKYQTQLGLQNKRLEIQNKQLEILITKEAWSIIKENRGEEQSYGRIKAIENLNKLKTSLNLVDLDNADLTGMDLKTGTEHSAKLAYAKFNNAGLNGANLSGADLNHSEFKGAKLGSANLTGANLTGAIFGDNNCTEEKKKNNYEKTKKLNLNCANLEKTNLTDVKGLTPEQVKKAYNWKAAIYSEDFCKNFSEEDLKPSSCNQL